MSELLQWLLSGDPWVEYGTRRHLLGQNETDIEVLAAKKKMQNHPQIQSLFLGFEDWNRQIVSNHKNAGLLLHKLSFLADIGMTIEDPRILRITDIILENRTSEGVVKVPINVPTAFGGTGENTFGWCLCDTPSILYALAVCGLGNDPRVQTAARTLASYARDNGWGCVISPELGKFRGPGKKSDPCPYATLLMLKALAQMPEYRDGYECRSGAECLLDLWTCSHERHPYMFYMGTDFRKIKAPFVWYDILHVVEVLSQFEWIRKDERLLQMVATIQAKADENGCYTPESEWKAWNGWEFSQKRLPSRWATYCVLRSQKRLGLQFPPSNLAPPLI